MRRLVRRVLDRIVSGHGPGVEAGPSLFGTDRDLAGDRDLEGGEGFDLIINCSTIEHVGLAGRYGVAVEDADGDLRAMRKLLFPMRPRGRMLVTLPVGRDAVIRPLHRVYGAARLPELLRGFVAEETC